MPTRPLQTIITTAKTVSRANVGTAFLPSMMVAISATSMTVTASVSMRTTDIVGRFGGEEFVALLPGTIADAKIVAERVRNAFQAAGLTVAGCDLNATVSVGAASGQPGTDIVALLAAADAALYRAKANGRNRVEVKPEGEMPILFATTPPRLPVNRPGRDALVPPLESVGTLAAGPSLLH